MTYAGSTIAFDYDLDGLLTHSGDYTIHRKTENGLPDQVSGGSLYLDRNFNTYGETDRETYTVNGIAVGTWSVTARIRGTPYLIIASASIDKHFELSKVSPEPISN